jgi:carbonic anhydrase
VSLKRRDFLLSGAALSAASLLPSLRAAAIAAAGPPATTLSPSQALAQLVAGNKRFTAGASTHLSHLTRLDSLASGQAPWAVILSCSDSRVPPEIIFDQGLGDLFVIRIAGNYAEAGGIGSMEYAIDHFHSPILLVLGHSSCGAVHATVDNLKAGSPPVPGNIQDIVTAIRPAAQAVLHNAGDVYANTIAENVRENVAKLKSVGPIIGPAVKSGKLEILGGVYDFKTGSVALL